VDAFFCAANMMPIRQMMAAEKSMTLSTVL
jgi:hypothetical protein